MALLLLLRYGVANVILSVWPLTAAQRRGSIRTGITYDRLQDAACTPLQ